MLRKLYGKFIESNHVYFALNLAAKPAKADVDAIPTRREKMKPFPAALWLAKFTWHLRAGTVTSGPFTSS
jgi:hypothetical protein